MVFVPAPLFCGSSTAKMVDYPHNISHFTDGESRMKNPHNPGVDSAPANTLFIIILLSAQAKVSITNAFRIVARRQLSASPGAYIGK
ncbi:hypothetical protein SAMN04487787_11864 [Kosakonia sacchari]|nr:hypothetical protein SAMN04487787_11864 [Kosakonia sacchari]